MQTVNKKTLVLHEQRLDSCCNLLFFFPQQKAVPFCRSAALAGLGASAGAAQVTAKCFCCCGRLQLGSVAG